MFPELLAPIGDSGVPELSEEYSNRNSEGNTISATIAIAISNPPILLVRKNELSIRPAAKR
jgi:hypothetical protein